MEIIGEGAAHISQATRDCMPTIPWSSAVGARNRLIHGYDDVDFDILWDIVQLDLPALLVELRLAPGGERDGGG